MSSESWIAPFIQQVLPVYLDQTSQDDIEVEDNGTSLSFRRQNHGHHHTAIVLEWGMGPSDDRAVLMDTELQIDTIISTDRLPVYKPDLTTTNPIPANPKRRLIKLLDFKLVVTHTTYPPDVELFINDFQIEWGKEASAFQPRKKIRKDKNIKALLGKVYDKAQGLSKAVDSTKPRTSTSGVSGQTPKKSQGDPLNRGMESQQIYSQVPRDPPCNPDHLEYTSKEVPARSYGAMELLKHLGPKSLLTSNKKSRHTTQDQTVPKGPEEGDPDTRRNTRQIEPISKADNGSAKAKSPILNRSPESTSRQSSICSQVRNEDELHTSPGAHGSPIRTQANIKAVSPSCNVMQSPLKKRQRKSSDGLSESGGDEDKSRRSREHIPATKKQKLAKETDNLAQFDPEEPVTVVPIPISSHKSVVPRSNPWESITEDDFNIPKDQRQLLESDSICWVPPRTGEPMPQGHVPPSLLKMWNNYVERRHHVAEERKAILERSLATPQESDTSSVASDSTEHYSEEWNSSPEPSPRLPHNDLPPSSPVVQRARRKQPSPSPINDIISSGLEQANNAVVRDLPKAYRAESSQFPGQTATGDRQMSETPSARSGSSDNEEVNRQILSQLSVTLAPPEGISLRSPTPSTNLRTTVDAQEDDSDDESVMDTSVPFALGEKIPDPTQSSQFGEGLTSSGPSLPAVNGESVQVAVTPVLGCNRHHNLNPEPREGGLPSSDPSSSQMKTSSQPLILDTYPFHTTHEQSQSSHEAPTPSGQGQERVIPVDVPGTQLPASSVASPWKSQQSQNVTNNYQSDIVLDSSGPAQRHQDFSVSATRPSPIALKNDHGPTESQQCEPTRNPVTMDHAPNEPARSQAPLSSLPRIDDLRPTPTDQTNQSPQGGSHKSPRDIEEDDVKDINTQSSSLVARRRGFVNNTETYAEAREVYRKFCSDYPSYSGDFDHFTKLCGMLHAVRQQGKLHRSFLWDDFVTKHLTNYPRYLEKISSQDSETLSYEEYFFENFSRPFFRKRSLTARGIDLAASQFTPDEKNPVAASNSSNPAPAHTRDPALDISFTSSLVEKFTNLQAQSFNGLSQADTSIQFPYLKRPANASSPEIKCEGSAADPIYIDSSQIFSQDAFQVKPASNTPALESNRHYSTQVEAQTSIAPVKVEAEVEVESQVESEVESELEHEVEAKLEVEANDIDIDMEEIPETDPEDVDQDEDTLHETASVELGDETFVSSRAPSHAEDRPTPAILPETIPASPEICEPESDSENWFLSLQHIRPKSPVWSDGPTEFKRWAEADLNVRSDRLHRGGSKVLLDDKGVVRRLIHR
ncbi:hypothetical protein N7520_005013 [Penicillium odoratum]|uniref:uncharacterized protein n=1 Tax=Penicillium odoratum TaxID=1167516 RepID=UPI00254704A2|nr:uncharacterized protein N7520_005013 [Penicillium odoratum]KAJ5765454.1 hypothetical protein N7520_005013 [Penicillium odoratum]